MTLVRDPQLDSGFRRNDDEWCATNKSKEPAAIRHRSLYADQHHFALGIRKSECQHFRAEFADLPRRKIDDAGNLSSHKAFARVARRELCRGLADAEFRPQIDFELLGRLPRLGEVFGFGDRSHAHVDFQKIVKSDLWAEHAGGHDLFRSSKARRATPMIAVATLAAMPTALPMPAANRSTSRRPRSRAAMVRANPGSSSLVQIARMRK